MPEISVIEISIHAGMALIDIVIGWVLRGRRSADEKAAVNAGWQEQIEAQRNEHERLVEQNKGLMEQVNQFQASNIDAKNRAKELAEAVQEAFSRRDDLQREIKDIRSNLEISIAERDQLRTDMQTRSNPDPDDATKDEKIQILSNELENWQNRLPPLIERFRERNAEAEQLEADLEIARTRILELETASNTEQTHIAPGEESAALTNGHGVSDETPELADDESIDEFVDAIRDEVDISAETNLGDESDPTDEDDDEEPRDKLQQIKGIGPAIEKTLNEMGIFRYHQIAEMSEYDIDRVAQRLKGFRSRIYREDWIGQARDLRDQNASG